MAFSEVRVPAVDRAFDVLEILGRSGRGLTLTELSREVGIPKSTTHYLIYTLVARGYVQRSPGSRQYSLGLRAFDFATAGVAELQLRRISSPHIQALARRLRLTVQTAVLKAGEGVIIDKADSPREVWGGCDSWIGRHFDLHCTAQGKALIAWLPKTELESLFANRGLARFTRHTICSLDDLEAHLAETRQKGFGVNDEEHILGVRGVAGPVFNHIGSVIASVSVRGSLTEIPDWRIQDLGNDVIYVAQEISRHLLDCMPLYS
jgi:DNA-binding IclR family transcriptional regulator